MYARRHDLSAGAYPSGAFGAHLDGVPLSGFRSAKVRAQLAYLAVEAGHRHRREAPATLLWGEYPEHDAQRSLSQALTNLRRLLAPLSSRVPPASAEAGPLLDIAGQAVEWRPRPDLVWVDLQTFESLLGAADPRRASALEERNPCEPLAKAVALYRGPFLAGLSLPGCPEFEEWRLLHQEQRHLAALLALERLVGCHLAAGRTYLVQPYARQMLPTSSTTPHVTSTSSSVQGLTSGFARWRDRLADRTTL